MQIVTNSFNFLEYKQVIRHPWRFLPTYSLSLATNLLSTSQRMPLNGQTNATNDNTPANRRTGGVD